MSALDFLLLLGFKTAILSAAVVVAWFFLRLFRCRSPKIHRTAWAAALLLGIIGAGLPVSIPVAKTPTDVEITAQNTVISEPVTAVWPETTIPFDKVSELVLGVTERPVVELHGVYHPTTNRIEIVPETKKTFSIEAAYTTITVCWIAGIAGFLLWRFSLYLLLLHRLKTANVAEGAAAEQWSDLCTESNIRSKCLSLLLTDHLGPGLVWRLSGAAVLVPRDLWEETAPEIREGILRHELAHYRNGDMLRSGVARLLALVHWFNPLAWFALKKMDEATEWVCDLAAFGTMTDGTLRFAQSMVAVHEAAPTVLLNHYAFGGGTVSRRAKKLQEYFTQPKESAMKMIVISSLLVVCLLLGTLQIRFVTVAAEPEKTTEETATVSAISAAEQAPGIQVELTDPDGKPCTTGYVRTYPNPRPKDWEGDQPRNFELKDGKCFVPISNFEKQKSFKMVLFADGFAPYVYRWPDTAQEKLPKLFSFQMPDRAAEPIGGRIVDTEGKPVVGASVNFTVSVIGRQNRPEPFGSYGQWVKTDADGYWVYKVLPKEQFEKNFDMNVTHDVYPKYRIVEGQTFKDYAAKGPGGKFAKTVTLPKGLTLRGKITDEQGNPVSGVIVHTAVKRDEKYDDNIYRHAVTRSDGNGEFLFENCSPKGELRTVDIGVCHRDFAPDVVSIEEITPDMKPLEIVLKKGKKLILKAVEKDGKPLEGMNISSNFWKNSWGNAAGTHQLFVDADRFGVAKTGKDGRFVWNAPDNRFDLTIGNENSQNVKIDYETLKYGDEENVYVFKPLLEVTGSVVDAETGKAIPNFTVTEWFKFKQSSGLTREFNSQAGKDGKFTRKIGQRFGEFDGYYLRVEAEGYEGLQSEDLIASESDRTLEFKLKMATNKFSTNLTGTVLQPDGKPAANVEIGVGSTGNVIYTKNGRLETHGIPRASRTNGQGKFSISRSESIGDQDYRLLFLHETGMISLTKEAFEKHGGPITLLPWARIEGTVRSGSTPLAGVSIWYQLRDEDADWEGKKPRISMTFDRSIKSDPNGKFVIERVYPGTAEVGRMVILGNDVHRTWQPFLVQHLDIKPGETHRVDLGGGGYRVKGQIYPSPERKVDWQFGRVMAKPSSPEMVALPALTEEAKKLQREMMQDITKLKDGRAFRHGEIGELVQKWMESPEGKKKMEQNPTAAENLKKCMEFAAQYEKKPEYANRKQIVSAVDDEGRFQLDDLTPGNWTLEIELNFPTDQGPWNNPADFWHKKMEISVPRLPEGSTDAALNELLEVRAIAFGFDKSERKGTVVSSK